MAVYFCAAPHSNEVSLNVLHLAADMPPKKKRAKPQTTARQQPKPQKHCAVAPLVIPSPPFSHSPASHLPPLTSPPLPSSTSSSPITIYTDTLLPGYSDGMQLPSSNNGQLQLLADKGGGGGGGGGGGIVAQQQKELELMILELQDRDTELNSLVEIQQRQAAVWAEDRQKVLVLEQQCAQLQALEHSREQELTLVKTSLSEMQCSDRERSATIHTLQLRLEETEAERNKMASLYNSMEARVSEAGERERRLQARLVEREGELMAAQDGLHTAQQVTEETRTAFEAVQKEVEDRDQQLHTLRDQQLSSEQELVKREEELLRSQQEREQLQTQLIAMSVEMKQLRTEVKMAGECDRRKEQLLQLQRSKLERHMREMDTLKKMCSHQDKQIATLKKQLQAITIPKPSPWQLLPPPVVQDGAGSEVDELTELLERAGTCEEDSGGAAVPSSAMSHSLHEHTGFKTAVVSPQKQPAPSESSKQLHQLSPSLWPQRELEEISVSRTRTYPRHPQRHKAFSTPTVPRGQEPPAAPRGQELPAAPRGQEPPIAPQETRESCRSPLSVDLDHLAQEVREKIANIFDRKQLPKTRASHVHT